MNVSVSNITYEFIRAYKLVEYSTFVLQDLFAFFSTLLEIFDWGTDINNVKIYGADCMNCNNIGTSLDSKSILPNTSLH